MKKLLKVLICMAFLMACYANFAFASSQLTDKGYVLDKMLIVSRHNIRAPLSGPGSVPYRITPNKWITWSAPAGELSLHGGVAETIMGQYFRKYLEDEGFMPENWQPADGQVRFYANSFQRTIATAQYFSTGMLPIANVRVERTLELNGSDPVFLPDMGFDSKEIQDSEIYINGLFEGKGLPGFHEHLSADIDKLEDLIDFKDSEYAKSNGVEHLDRTDFRLKFRGENKNVLGYQGMAYDMVSVCDTLLMQYYETPDNKKAAFGKDFSYEDWKSIGRIISDENHIHWGNPVAAKRLTKNILQEMERELCNDNRKFTFLCGHDTNVASLMTILNTEDYVLPETIATRTAIGGKIVIEKRIGADGKAYANVNMVYASDNQVRNCQQIDLSNPPMIYPINFKGLQKNDDGLYQWDDVMNLIKEAQ